MLNAVTFNDTEFAFEKFEHEVVVLHLIEGTYYAIGGAAVSLWEHLVAKQSLASMHLIFDSSGNNDPKAMSGAIARFVDQLVAERIFLPAEASIESTPATADKAGSAVWEVPTFEKHADMQDLLTLDPIHDVDPEKGWPHTVSEK
jgi:hypothetical protein